MAQTIARVMAAAAVLAIVRLTTVPAASASADEVRGLWVQRTSLTSPESIAAMVRAAESGGFNTLLVQVRGRGEAFYRSDLEPRASDLDRQPAAFDPLAATIEAAHAAGLRVHAWVNTNLVASGAILPRSQRHVVFRHPEWIMAPKSLASTLKSTSPRSPAYVGTLARWTRAAANVEGLYLSPVTSASREYTASVFRELVSRYPLDGVHLDYIRYPASEFDYSPAALAEFRAWMLPRTPMVDRQRIDRAALSDAAAWTAAFPIQWSSFRRDRLTMLVARIREEITAARPGTTISSAVIPVAAEARDERLQDWLGWARAGLVNVVCPMIYTTDAAEFASLASDVAAQLDGVPFWAGVGAWRLPVDRTIDHVRLARRHGAGGVLLFSYEKLTDSGTTPAGFTALRPVLLDAPGSGGAR